MPQRSDGICRPWCCNMNKKRSKEDVDRLERYMTHLVGVIRNCKSSD